MMPADRLMTCVALNHGVQTNGYRDSGYVLQCRDYGHLLTTPGGKASGLLEPHVGHALHALAVCLPTGHTSFLLVCGTCGGKTVYAGPAQDFVDPGPGASSGLNRHRSELLMYTVLGAGVVLAALFLPKLVAWLLTAPWLTKT